MKIYTKTGDEGTTALYGGERVPKDARRVDAYGTVDEANAALGVARAHAGGLELDAELASLQNTLFDLGADLATPEGSRYRRNLVPVGADDVARVEGLIDRFEAELPPLGAFILPGGHLAAAALHLARTVVRRAERAVVELARAEAVNPLVGVYLNRLSDLLFVLARVVNLRAGVSEALWHTKGRG